MLVLLSQTINIKIHVQDGIMSVQYFLNIDQKLRNEQSPAWLA